MPCRSRSRFGDTRADGARGLAPGGSHGSQAQAEPSVSSADQDQIGG
jgi:hypothetical protein